MRFVLAAFLMAVGCAAQDRLPRAAPGAGDQPIRVEAAPGGRWIDHAAGRTWVPDGVTRVASVGLADELLFLGVTPVGAVGSWGNDFLPHQQALLAGQTYLGGEHLPHAVRLEALYAARPDLIIANVGLAEAADALARIAPTVVLRGADRHPAARIRDVALILDRAAQAERALAWRDRKLAAAREILALAVGEAPVGVVRGQHRRLKLYGAGWFYGPTLYGDLGLRPPPFTARWVGARVNAWLPLEHLPEYRPAHLFVLAAPAPGVERSVDTLLASEAWADVPAVRDGHVYAADIRRWMGGGIMARCLMVDDAVRALAPEGLKALAAGELLGGRPPWVGSP